MKQMAVVLSMALPERVIPMLVYVDLNTFGDNLVALFCSSGSNRSRAGVMASLCVEAHLDCHRVPIATKIPCGQ